MLCGFGICAVWLVGALASRANGNPAPGSIVAIEARLRNRRGRPVAISLPRRPHLHRRINESALDENLRRALASATRALEERTELARKLYNQAMTSRHRLLVENWTQKIKEFEREADIIRNSTRRMDRIAAQAEMARESAAE